jgi:hypothetical protein
MYTEKSVLNDKNTQFELLMILDLLNEMSFVFPDFEEEKDRTELKQPEMIQLTSKKKKVKQNTNFVKHFKEIVTRLEEHFISQSKTRTFVEIGSQEWVVTFVTGELIPALKQILTDGFVENAHIWKMIAEIANNDPFCKELIAVVKKTLDKKSLNVDLLFETLIKLLVNTCKLNEFLHHVQDSDLFETYYEKGAILKSTEGCEKVVKYFAKIDRLTCKIPY